MTPEAYFKEHNLWDLERLKQHAEHNSVWVTQSDRFPGLHMLHYKDECQYENKWSTFARMCRGLIVNIAEQRIVAYPFDKFFNLGQVPETSYENLKAIGGFQTTEKLDGSMIICFLGDMNSIQFTTKGSFDSEHGQYAYTLPMQYGYNYEAFKQYAQNGTLMFELVTKKFQIVVDYKKKGYTEGLYLIGYRTNKCNKLTSILELRFIAGVLGVPMFQTYDFDNLDNLIETAKNLPVLDEGYVLRFEGDLLVKIKGTAYLRAHRFISRLSDRNILESISIGEDNLLVELAPEEYRADVVTKIQQFKIRCRELIDSCYTYYDKAPKESRKEFAMWTNKEVPSYLRGFMFNILDNKGIDTQHMYRVIEEVDNVSGATKL